MITDFKSNRSYSTQACFIATKVTLKHHRARLHSFSIKFSPKYIFFFSNILSGIWHWINKNSKFFSNIKNHLVRYAVKAFCNYWLDMVFCNSGRFRGILVSLLDTDIIRNVSKNFSNNYTSSIPWKFKMNETLAYQPLIMFAKSSIANVWQGNKRASDQQNEFIFLFVPKKCFSSADTVSMSLFTYHFFLARYSPGNLWLASRIIELLTLCLSSWGKMLH